MSLRKAIYQFISGISSINTDVGGRIYFNKVTKRQGIYPYIVYSLDGYENKIGFNQGKHGYRGEKVVIDVVAEYSNDDKVEDIGESLQKELGGFQGLIGDGINGSISIVYVERGYDTKNDTSIYRIALFIKYTF